MLCRCDRGSYGNRTGLSSQRHCLACPTGFYCPAGSTNGTILECPAGRYGETDSLFDFRCSGECSPGYYCPATSTIPKAMACPAGTFNSLAGQGEIRACNVCPKDSYCPLGTEKPVVCGLGLSTTSTGKVHVFDCLCNAGTYGNGSISVCHVCPPLGSNCSVPGATLQELPILPGWWRVSTEYASLHRCSPSWRCIGTWNATARATNGTEDLCAPGHKGPYCALCASGFFLGQEGGCSPCEEASEGGGSAGTIVVGVVVGVFLFSMCGYCYCMRKRQHSTPPSLPGSWQNNLKDLLDEDLTAIPTDVDDINLAMNTVATDTAVGKAVGGGGARWRKMFHVFGKLASRLSNNATKIKMLVTLYQILSTIGGVFSIDYPDEYMALLKWLSIANVDFLSFVPLACTTVPSGFYTTLGFRTGVPALLVGSLYFIGKRFNARRTGSSPSDDPIASACFSIAFILLFLLYPGCTNTYVAGDRNG